MSPVTFAPLRTKSSAAGEAFWLENFRLGACTNTALSVNGDVDQIQFVSLSGNEFVAGGGRLAASSVRRLREPPFYETNELGSRPDLRNQVHFLEG
jgi:hypothetical protein